MLLTLHLRFDFPVSFVHCCLLICFFLSLTYFFSEVTDGATSDIFYLVCTLHLLILLLSATSFALKSVLGTAVIIFLSPHYT